MSAKSQYIQLKFFASNTFLSSCHVIQMLNIQGPPLSRHRHPTEATSHPMPLLIRRPLLKSSSNESINKSGRRTLHVYICTAHSYFCKISYAQHPKPHHQYFHSLKFFSRTHSHASSACPLCATEEQMIHTCIASHIKSPVWPFSRASLEKTSRRWSPACSVSVFEAHRGRDKRALASCLGVPLEWQNAKDSSLQTSSSS